MNIVVPIKQVPDLVEELEIDDSGKDLNREWLKMKTNEFDDHALEEAYCSCQAKLDLKYSLTVNPRVQDIPNAVNRDRIQYKDLVEAGFQNMPHPKQSHQDNHRYNTR